MAGYSKITVSIVPLAQEVFQGNETTIDLPRSILTESLLYTRSDFEVSFSPLFSDIAFTLDAYMFIDLMSLGLA